MSRKSSRHARRISFIWGGARAVPGRWYLGLVGLHDPAENGRHRGIAISVRALLLWLLALGLVAYFAAATALFFWLDRRPFNLVTYSDVVLPTRWSRIRDLRGLSYIEEGMDNMKNGRWLEGEMKLRIGLGKHPEHLRARLTLGQFYLAIGRRPQAMKIFQDGLRDGYPGRVYVNAVLQVAVQSEDYATAVSVCETCLARPADTVPAKDRQWLRQQKIQLLLTADRPQEAWQALQEEPAGSSAQEDELRVLALIALDRKAEADAFLKEWRGRVSDAGAAQVLRLQVRVARELGHIDAMNAALAELRRLSPADPRPLVYAVVQQSLARQPAAAAASMDDYIRRFGSTVANLQLAAEPLAEIGALPLLQRCVDEAAAQGLPLRSLQAAQTRALLHAGDIRGAARVFAALNKEPKAASRAEDLWMAWMSRLIPAMNGPAESAQVVELLAFLRSRPLPVRVYRETISVLREGGRWETAREVLAMATGSYPASAALAADKTEVERKLAELRVDEPEKSAPAVAAGPREKAVFEELDQAIGAGQWSDVAAQIRNVRLAKPAWLPKRENELLRLEMRAHFETGMLPDMLGAAKLLLDGSNARSQQVVDFAGELHARGAKDEARMLLREVLRKSPDYPPAKRALQELDAKEAKA